MTLQEIQEIQARFRLIAGGLTQELPDGFCVHSVGIDANYVSAVIEHVETLHRAYGTSREGDFRDALRDGVNRHNEGVAEKQRKQTLQTITLKTEKTK